MGKTKNPSPLATGGQGLFGQLRGRQTSLPPAPLRGSEKISATIMELCRQSEDSQQAAQQLRDSGQDSFLDLMIDPGGRGLLADTLASAYFLTAKQQVDISGHNLLSDQIIKRGLLLPKPIDSQFLFTELRWSLAHNLVSNVSEQPPTAELHQLLSRCSGHSYASTTERDPHSKFGLAALKNFQQAIEESREDQQWSLYLSAQQVFAAQQGFTTMDYLLNQPERPGLFRQIAQTVSAAQEAFQPALNDQQSVAEEIVKDFGQKITASWILGACSIAIDRQLGQD